MGLGEGVICIVFAILLIIALSKVSFISMLWENDDIDSEKVERTFNTIGLCTTTNASSSFLTVQVVAGVGVAIEGVGGGGPQRVLRDGVGDADVPVFPSILGQT